MQGFIVNAANTEVRQAYADMGGASGGGTNTPCRLQANSGVDARSKAMPQSCYLSHLDLRLTNANAATTVSCFLTWDTAGDQPMTGEATGQRLSVGRTTANSRHVSISIDAVVTAPTVQSNVGEAVLWVIVDDETGNPEIASARLHWADSRAGNH
tara:strand:+ start:623 stop:1087 length:465 start_codon:yes stop_codon:yes gene_type:complete